MINLIQGFTFDYNTCILSHNKIGQRCIKVFRLANYYRRFVKNFVKIVKSLHELTRRKQKWE